MASVEKSFVTRLLPSDFCRLLPAFCLMALAGCAGDNRLAGDPLFGGLAAAPARPAVATPAPQVAALPPVPIPNTGNNAALAANGSRPLDSTYDLRMGNQAQPAGSWAGQPAANNMALASIAGSRISSFEQVQAMLTARGVVWQELRNVGDRGEWKFSCSIANPQNRSINRVYEAQAQDYLSAMRAVLEQVDREQIGRASCRERV